MPVNLRLADFVVWAKEHGCEHRTVRGSDICYLIRSDGPAVPFMASLKGIPEDDVTASMLEKLSLDLGLDFDAYKRWLRGRPLLDGVADAIEATEPEHYRAMMSPIE